MQEIILFKKPTCYDFTGHGGLEGCKQIFLTILFNSFKPKSGWSSVCNDNKMEKKDFCKDLIFKLYLWDIPVIYI